ncbi:hypothetical protein QT381_07995 [Galbitalea sp. SE-J8]|uniref:hypothetical protein n=1 Tax=Galbitalea sp. SE-J8 TaxID=3054952 RepID=UPI00259C7738|nr:hypothetical protein [Galbitalea sp. SE-J8]MDM4762946.1 hypothetical protein [Galbitalea sp. SE-J8]
MSGPLLVVHGVPPELAGGYGDVARAAGAELAITGPDDRDRGGWLALAALARDAGLVDRPLVVRHVHDGPAAVERLRSFLGGGAESLAARVLGDLDLAGVYAARRGPAPGRAERAAARELLRRSGAWQRIEETGAAFGTCAVRGPILAAIALLRLGPEDTDALAGGAIELAFAALIAQSGLGLLDIGAVEERPSAVPVRDRARTWWVLHPGPIGDDRLAVDELAVGAFVVPCTWGDDGFDVDAARRAREVGAPVVPWLRLEPAVAQRSALDGLDATTRARIAADVGAWRDSVAPGAGGRRALVVDDTLALLGGAELVTALRTALESAWIAVTESPLTVRADEIVAVAGADAVLDVPPTAWDRRHRVYRGDDVPDDRSIRVVDLSALGDVDPAAARAQAGDPVVPGVLLGWHDDRERARHWNPLRVRAMAERSVRAVAAREDDERTVVVSSWNGADGSGLRSSPHEPLLRGLLRDALGRWAEDAVPAADGGRDAR